MSDISSAEIEGHSNNPFKSSRPLPPIRFLFNCKFCKHDNVANPYKTEMLLSLRFKLTKLTKHSNPYILLIIFSCIYKQRKFTNFYNPSMFFIALPYKYNTFNPK